MRLSFFCVFGASTRAAQVTKSRLYAKLIFYFSAQKEIEMATKKSSTESKPAVAAEKSDGESAASAEAAAPERRKSPLEMVRERQAKQQASRSGIGKKGGGGSSQAGGAPGADGVTKPVQVKRQMGG